MLRVRVCEIHATNDIYTCHAARDIDIGGGTPHLNLRSSEDAFASADCLVKQLLQGAIRHQM